jgi:Protein of unknown function (DUF2971)
MTLPPFYKFLNVEGAKLTLRNGTFKHAHPSDFNDLEDMTVTSLFPESNEEALEQIKTQFNGILLRNLDRRPKCQSSQMRKQIEVLQELFRAYPEVAEAIDDVLKEDDIAQLYDLERLREQSEIFVEEINGFMRDYRVLCVTCEINNDQMWKRYAEDSQGIALRILPNLEKDSKFQLFRRVKYSANRPPIYGNVLDFLEQGLFRDQIERTKEIIEDIVISKTLEWEYEQEYRLAIPVPRNADWNTMPYHPEEISELYFGANGSAQFETEIRELAKARNPEIRIFRACRDNYGRLLFLP